jgi:hypothetical protein
MAFLVAAFSALSLVAAEDDSKPEAEAFSQLYPRSKEEIRDRIKEIEKRDGPAGIDREQQKTVNELNIYRYLSGVSDNVEADAKMVGQAMDAAQACKEHGGMSHDLGHSTDICNLSSGGSMSSSVKQYIHDIGEKNRDKRGHRRWCLNPEMGKTGFGFAKKYFAMVVTDTSGGAIPKDSWAYPGKGFFPQKYLQGDAWSLYLTENAPGWEDIKVEVYELSKRPEKTFSSSEEIPGKAVPVLYVGTYLNAINFEPQADRIKRRGIYWVRIEGEGVHEGYVVELY